MNPIILALNKKASAVATRFNNLNMSSNPRIPVKLHWLAVVLKEWGTSAQKTPQGYVSVPIKGLDGPVPIDQMARTFCALEDFESWLNKVEEGIKKHQQEIEKQSEMKIIRLKTFASLG